MPILPTAPELSDEPGEDVEADRRRLKPDEYHNEVGRCIVIM